MTQQIEACADAAGADTIPVPVRAIKEIKIKNKTIDFSLHLNYYDYIGFTVSTSALCQIENAALAIRALERLEEILPSVYIDGARNIDGIRAFMETVRTQPCSGRRKLLFSVVKDKTVSGNDRSVGIIGVV